ncbi:MAG: pirin family protein [Pseudonocardiales bacterium]
MRRAAARYGSVQPGITSWHCFSSGPHYDPTNAGFGSVIALDEHAVAAGAGFARHAHRGVEILSWVLAGTLSHEDSTGGVEHVGPGTVLYQSAGSGIEHTEANASGTEPLRFVQLVLLGPVAAPRHRPGESPVAVGDGEVEVLVPTHPVELAAASHTLVFVACGSVLVNGQRLSAGDSARVRDTALRMQGDGEVLTWRSIPSPR